MLAASGRATAEGVGGVDPNCIPSTSSQYFTSHPQPGIHEKMLRFYRKAVYMLDIFLEFSPIILLSPLEHLKWVAQGSS